MSTVEISAQYIQHITPLVGAELPHFIAACQRPLRKSIRINTLTTDAQQWLSVSSAEKQTPVPWWPNAYWIEDDSSLASGNNKLHIQGAYYIQEASSMLPVAALLHDNQSPLPTQPLILDMAAAPGSKTTQLAAALDNQGCIIANELSSTRLKYLAANVQRMGVTNTCLTHFDGIKFGQYLPETFDAIILDAPCGGEGTVRKDPTALKNWNLPSVQEMAALQKRLIRSAFLSLKTGGVMIYSTCTLSKEENQDVCYSLMQEFGDLVEFESLATLFDGAERALTEEGFLHVFPQIFDSEGFFIAKIRKLGPTTKASELAKPYLKKFPFEPLPTKNQKPFFAYLNQQFGMKEAHISGSIWQRDKEIWLLPDSIKHLIGVIKFNRIGIKLADVYPKNYRLSYDFAIAFGHLAQRNRIELNQTDTKSYLMGKDIKIEDKSQMGEQILTSDQVAIGLGKCNKGKLKNQLPRELVKDKLNW
jgi:16S rRNA (cytosine1407-C5)-methyltransferase